MPTQAATAADPEARPVTLTDLGIFTVCARKIERRWDGLTIHQQRRALALLSELSAATRIPKGGPPA